MTSYSLACCGSLNVIEVVVHFVHCVLSLLERWATLLGTCDLSGCGTSLAHCSHICALASVDCRRPSGSCRLDSRSWSVVERATAGGAGGHSLEFGVANDLSRLRVEDLDSLKLIVLDMVDHVELESTFCLELLKWHFEGKLGLVVMTLEGALYGDFLDLLGADIEGVGLDLTLTLREAGGCGAKTRDLELLEECVASAV